jgi:hypothetical protein
MPRRRSSLAVHLFFVLSSPVKADLDIFG